MLKWLKTLFDVHLTPDEVIYVTHIQIRAM